MKKSLKKIMAGVSAAAMLASAMPIASAFAEETEATFSVREVSEGVVITDYSDKTADKIVIPSEIDGQTVVGVDDFAFGLISKKVTVVVPETLTEDYISSQAFMTMAIVDKYIIGLSPDKTINGVIKYWVNSVAGLNYSDQQIADAIARAMAHIGNIDVTDLTVSEAAIQVLREIDSLGFSETNLNRLEAAFSLMPYDLVTLEGPDGTAAQAFAKTKNSLTYVVTGAYESGDVTMDGKVDLYDAIEIAKYMMGMVDFTNEQIAIGDMTGDGVCDLYDAIEVARTLM
ncbi:hypothetical protein Osc2_28470 [Ruminococcus sp. 25CYCFAH16]